MTVSLTRRGFVAGFVALASASAVKALPASSIPRIWQDGVHCDAEGVEALLSRKQVLIGDELVQRATGPALLENVNLHLLRTVRLSGLRDCVMRNVRFVPRHAERYVLFIDHSENVDLMDLWFDLNGYNCPRNGCILTMSNSVMNSPVRGFSCVLPMSAVEEV